MQSTSVRGSQKEKVAPRSRKLREPWHVVREHLVHIYYSTCDKFTHLSAGRCSLCQWRRALVSRQRQSTGDQERGGGHIKLKYSDKVAEDAVMPLPPIELGRSIGREGDTEKEGGEKR